MAAAANRVGVLILRAWTEDCSDPMRVRVTSTLDISNGLRTETVAVTAAEAVDLVREWLETFSHSQ